MIRQVMEFDELIRSAAGFLFSAYSPACRLEFRALCPEGTADFEEARLLGDDWINLFVAKLHGVVNGCLQ